MFGTTSYRAGGSPLDQNTTVAFAFKSTIATGLSHPSDKNLSTLPVGTSSETTDDVDHDFAYPSWQLVIIICTCALTISGTVLGNVLVCTAVAIVRKLRTPSNLLIVSLAVSDLLVAVLVMPLATAYEVKGRWVFGQPLCDMWTSLDVLLCTASILNLCMISIDRYFVITRPFQYAMKRTPARMTLMILSVWMLSAIISIPPLFGWKEPPKPDQCNITQDIGYQFYATIGAFYLPLVVMVVIYYRIYQVSSRIAEAEARSKPSNGHHHHHHQNSLTVACSISVPQQSKPLLQPPLEFGRSSDTSCLETVDQPKKRKSLRCFDVHDECQGNKSSDTSRNWTRLQKVKLLQRFYIANGCASTDLQLVALKSEPQMSEVKSPLRSRGSNVDRRSTGEISRSSCKLLGRQKSSISSTSAPPGRTISQNSNAPSSLSKECKATRTLGVIMGTFIACWLPFFILALIKPFCSQPVDSCIPHWLSALFLWLGFANSLLNPIIYARFNREFRKPFREIILLRCRGINRRLRSDTYAEQFGPPSQDRLMVGVGHSHYSSAATLATGRPSIQPGKTLLKSAVVHYQGVQDRAVTKLDESCEMGIEGVRPVVQVTGGRFSADEENENVGSLDGITLCVPGNDSKEADPPPASSSSPTEEFHGGDDDDFQTSGQVAIGANCRNLASSDYQRIHAVEDDENEEEEDDDDIDAADDDDDDDDDAGDDDGPGDIDENFNILNNNNNNNNNNNDDDDDDDDDNEEAEEVFRDR